jgi:hypothetical protein
MARGKLRIYLGAAPGVGKTYAMLSEAHRRIERGTDCVVAFVEHHHRPRTEVMLHGLEQVPRREIGVSGGSPLCPCRLVGDTPPGGWSCGSPGHQGRPGALGSRRQVSDGSGAGEAERA